MANDENTSMQQPERFQPGVRTWSAKFSDAFAGLYLGIYGQSSFWVHFAAIFLVLGMAVFFRLPANQWCILLLCMGLVFSLELLNSSLESLSRSVTLAHCEFIDRSLKIASAAVLVGALVSLVVAGIIFLPHLLSLLASQVSIPPNQIFYHD